MNLASGWLAYYSLCCSGFRHIAFQIRLRLPRPCKILTSTLMSLCVFLMCPACSPTVPLLKPSKSVMMRQFDLQPLIPKDVFVELIKSATFSVEFSFNNTMYKQTNGVAMGSPLVPALANIFGGYYEEKLLSQMEKPPTYFRYVDDTFAIFDHEAEADEFPDQTQLPLSIPQIHL